MGMFDTLRVEYPLPLPRDLNELSEINWRNVDFQTKDLQNALQDYYIDATGQLWLERIDRKYDFSEGYGPNQLKVREVKLKPERCGYFGALEFYTMEYRDKNDYQIEFTAKLNDGKIEDLSLANFEVCDNTNRVKLDRQLKEDISIHRERQTKTWYKVYSKTWVPTVRVTTRGVERVGKFLINASWKVRNTLTPY